MNNEIIEIGTIWRHIYGDFLVTVINSEAKIEYRLITDGQIYILPIDVFLANFERVE